ncbi:hypothetical protein ACFYQA_22720 [Streptomyces sp. NPDC005774]|uniref:hypothetical protein n=1 Tax=Streptomyces sp. NPDC005774 TaxID=3364728 RepID=UPI0036823926
MIDVKISPRYSEEKYRMRSVPGGYPGDIVRHYRRKFYGTEYRFTHIVWGDGDVTFIVRVDDGADFLHRWDHVAG